MRIYERRQNPNIVINPRPNYKRGKSNLNNSTVNDGWVRDLNYENNKSF